MLRITAIAVACVFCTVGAAFADIEIWDGDDIDPPPTIDHDLNTIEIEAAGTYGFRAWDGDAALEEIRSITVDSGVTGAVTVTIAWDEYGGDGATDVWTGNLTHASRGGADRGPHSVASGVSCPQVRRRQRSIPPFPACPSRTEKT